MDKHRMEARDWQAEAGRLAGCVVGAFLYAAGLNLFAVPSKLYSGGIMGVSQLLRTLVVERWQIWQPGMDIAGVIYYAINIPLLALAFVHVGKKFFVRTIFTVTMITVFLALIPVRPVVDEVITSSLVGGIVSGIGLGLYLRMGSSGGGMDVVGLLLIKWRQNFSVGKANLIINVLLYAVCLFLFDMETVIYSLIFSAVHSVAIDKVHVQNINMEVKIISRMDTTAMERELMERLGRGVTRMETVGAFTQQPSHMLYILLSKYELPQLRGIVLRHDPAAFIVVNEGISVVQGNYLRRI